MTKFNELGLSETMLQAVETLGFTEATPIQAEAIPVVLEGRDLIAAAKTGTGKTAAFSLPCLDKFPRGKKGSAPKMLVLSPTRELATQIADLCSQVSKTTKHRIACLVGGVSYDKQISKLKYGVDVLIACPGRLIDLMERGAVRLNEVEYLVLDEADRMLDMGFLPPMKKIVAECTSRKQTLLFSATIDRKITSNMGSLLHDPAYVEIAHKGEVADTIDQYLIHTTQHQKTDLLAAVLQEKGFDKVIVFARTRHRSDNCVRRLQKMGFSAEAIHSDRSQSQRRRALNNFAKGKTNILVATDVLARGIDVSEVNYVINFDLPDQAEDYIHRIGRTGRAGAAGFSISFATPDTRSNLREIKRLTKQDIPKLELENWDPKQAEVDAARREQAWIERHDAEIVEAKREFKKRASKPAGKRNGNSSNSSGSRKAPRAEFSASERPANGKRKAAAVKPGGKSSNQKKFKARLSEGSLPTYQGKGRTNNKSRNQQFAGKATGPKANSRPNRSSQSRKKTMRAS